MNALDVVPLMMGELTLAQIAREIKPVRQVGVKCTFHKPETATASRKDIRMSSNSGRHRNRDDASQFERKMYAYTKVMVESRPKG